MADANGNHGSPERLIMADKGRGSGFHDEVLRRSPGTQAVLVLEPQNLVQKCPTTSLMRSVRHLLLPPNA